MPELHASFTENVVALMDRPTADQQDPNDEWAKFSNLDFACANFESLDMFVHVWLLDPKKDFSGSQSRPRLWSPQVPWAKLNDVCAEEATAILTSAMNIISGSSEVIGIEDLLLDEDDPLVSDAYASLRHDKLSPNSEYNRQKKRRVAGSTWVNKHIAAAEKQGKVWADIPARPDDLVFDLYPGLLQLTNRELDSLQTRGVKFPDVPGAIDVSQSYQRQAQADGYVGCTLPTMREYLTHRCRLAVGLESFHFQNIHYGKNHSLLRQLDEKVLSDLGGNAFEALQSPQP